MSVTFDAKFEKGFNGGASPNSFVSNAGTVAGTVGSNANRILLIAICANEAVVNLGNITVTWNGVSATLIKNASAIGAGYSSHLYGLINPATGNQTLSVAWDSGTLPTMYVGAVSVYNADQVTGWQNAGSDAATSTTADSTVTSASGNMAVGVHCDNNASSLDFDHGLSPAPTSAWIDTAFSANGGMEYLASTSGSTVLGWTLGTSVQWVNVKADVISALTTAQMLPAYMQDGQSWSQRYV